MRNYVLYRIYLMGKRWCVAMERAATALESIASCVKSDWEKKNIRLPGNKTKIESFDVDEANKRWFKELEAKRNG